MLFNKDKKTFDIWNLRLLKLLSNHWLNQQSLSHINNYPVIFSELFVFFLTPLSFLLFFVYFLKSFISFANSPLCWFLIFFLVYFLCKRNVLRFIMELIRTQICDLIQNQQNVVNLNTRKVIYAKKNWFKNT